MVLISIQPFAFAKIFLILAALLCFSALCFADPVLMTQKYRSPNSEEGLKRVDFPPRGQESPPWSEDAAKPVFRSGKPIVPGLVISRHFVYT
jgi:hypothetical protein